MKDLVIAALDSAFDQLIKQTPKTERVTKSISIWGVKPKDLGKFMADNNIPDDAYFDGKDNGYDGFDDVLLSWEISVPISDAEILKYRRRYFPSMVFKAMSAIFTDNGYKRVGVNSIDLYQFRGLICYDAYVNKEFDKLFSYYSLHFAKKKIIYGNNFLIFVSTKI